jgi:hypothetical protein
VNIDGRTVDLVSFGRLTLGQIAKVLGGERELGAALRAAVENGQWFTGAFPVVLDAFAEVRNRAAHGERIDRRTAAEWRDRVLGVGSVGEIVELARMQAKRSSVRAHR